MEISGLWLIPVLMILLVGGAALLVRWWMQRSQADMTQLSSAMRQMSGELTRRQAEAAEYLAELRSPYQAPGAELASELETAARLLREHSVTYAETRQAITAASVRQYDALLRAPIAWFDIRRRIGQLERQSEQARAALETIQTLLTRLQRLGVEVAERAKKAHQQLDTASEMAHSLRTAGLTGDAFQQAIRTGSRLRSSVQTIPAVFLAPEPEAVLAEADRETIIATDELLRENEPALDALLTSFQGWQRQVEEARTHLESSKKAVDELRSALLSPPPGLQTDRAEERLHVLEQSTSDLRSRLDAPEVDQLRELLQEARQSARTAQADLGLVSTARQQVNELRHALGEASRALDAVGRAMSEASQREHYPLQWDVSQPVLNSLLTRLDGLGPADRPRNPDQVTRDLIVSRELMDQVRSLHQTVKQAAQRHIRLVTLLESLDPRAAGERYPALKRLAAQVKEFAPENWPRQDAVAAFAGEVNEMMEQIQRVMPPEPAAALMESKLAAQLETAESAAARLQSVSERQERISKRLDHLHELESRVDQQLHQVVNLFNQVDRLAESNPWLAQLIARADTERLWSEGEHLADELFKDEKRRLGLVEKKTQKVDAFIKRVETLANQWVTRLETQLRAQRTELSEKIQRLRSIAPLDDPILAGAERLLNEESSAPAQTKQITLEEAMTAIKHGNDNWQRLDALLQGVENEVEAGVMPAYDAAVSARQTALQHLQGASQALPAGHSWPPSLQSLDEAEQAFAEAEQQWEGLRKGPVRSNRLILQLGEITRSYQMAQDLAERAVERAESERDRILLLENSIDEAVELWQNQAMRHADNPETQESISRLVGETQRARETLQRQYTQGGKSYHQVEQELRGLAKRINNAQVPAGAGRMDINGEERVGNAY